MDQQVAETLYLTATNLSELLVGVQLIPDGKRRRGIESALTGAIENLFSDRILPFDKLAALSYAQIIAKTRAAGITVSVADGQIAAIAKVRGFSVATRDAGPFVAAGVTVINPWTKQS